MQFDDDNLRGEEQHAVSLLCRQRITFARLTPLPIYFSSCEGNYIEFKPFYSKFLKDMLRLYFSYISAVAEIKEGMIKTQRKSQVKKRRLNIIQGLFRMLEIY